VPWLLILLSSSPLSLNLERTDSQEKMGVINLNWELDKGEELLELLVREAVFMLS
jgi:hypothetical protein